MAARDVAQALKTFASAARGVAASTEDAAARNAMLDCAADVLDKSGSLIEETKKAVVKPGDTESQQRLAQVGPQGQRSTRPGRAWVDLGQVCRDVKRQGQRSQRGNIS